MALREKTTDLGNWLFRWRGFLPLLMIGVFIIALRNFEYIYDSRKLDLIWEVFCFAISFFGLFIRIYTLGYTPRGTSGRNTKKQLANNLNTTGMYSLLRHPLYLGNFLIWFGIVLSTHSWYFFAFSVFIFLLYYEKIMFAEEEFLRTKFGDTYLKWANNTPLLIPKFKNWQSPNIPFSYKRVFKKEYTGFFGIIASFTILAILKGYFITKRLEFDLTWSILFVFGLIIYLSLKTYKKLDNKKISITQKQ